MNRVFFPYFSFQWDQAAKCPWWYSFCFCCVGRLIFNYHFFVRFLYFFVRVLFYAIFISFLIRLTSWCKLWLRLCSEWTLEKINSFVFLIRNRDKKSERKINERRGQRWKSNDCKIQKWRQTSNDARTAQAMTWVYWCAIVQHLSMTSLLLLWWWLQKTASSNKTFCNQSINW